MRTHVSVCLLLCVCSMVRTQRLRCVCGGGVLYISECPHKDRRLSEQLDCEGRIHSTDGKRWIKKWGGGAEMIAMVTTVCTGAAHELVNSCEPSLDSLVSNL